MANKLRKLFIATSVMAGLFMAITACGHQVSPSTTSQDTSSQEIINSSNEIINSSSDIISSSQEDSNSSTTPISSSEEPSSSLEPVVVLERIEAVSNKNGYERGEELDIVVTAYYSDGSSVAITDYQVEGFNNRTIGEQNITVSYGNQTCSLKVLVKTPVLTDISVVSNKESYEYGEELDIVVTANYSDGSSKEVTEYQVEGYSAQNPGEQDILITFEGKTSSLKVKVNDPVLLSITVEGQKDSYEYGEQLQIGVIAHYSDNTDVALNEYEIEGFDSTKVGEQNVTVKYEGKVFTFKVTIKNPVLTGISVTNNKDSYEWGEDLDIIVTATYSDNSSKQVNEYSVEGFNKEQSGEQNVVITYEGKTYSFKVIVNDPVLTSITAITNKESYDYGDDLDVVVVANYSDGSSVEITDYEVEGYNSENPGEQDLTFTYEGKSCKLRIAVNERTTYFPSKKLADFLQVEGIQTAVPDPIWFNEWFDSVEKEQDGTNIFVATTKDEGQVGVDSLADQYATTLRTSGWNVVSENNEYTATKDNGDVMLVFSTKKKSFSLRVNIYHEFPDYKFVGSLMMTKATLKDGDVIALGNIDAECMVAGFDNGYFNTEESTFTEKSVEYVSKNVWRFTVNKLDGGIYTFTDIYGRKLGSNGFEQLTWDEGSTEWKLLVTSQTCIIMNAISGYGRLCYNPADNRISAYETTTGNDLSYVQMFKISKTDLIYPTSISLDGRNEIGTGKTSRLNINYVPENANAIDEVIWTSSNENIAIVSNKGVVTGVSVGQTTITAKAKSKGSYLETSYVVDIKEDVLDRWTIMLYICGSNLESDYGSASDDIGEILQVSGQPEDVNIIIETGGTTKWHRYGISANALSRYHVENRNLVLDTTLQKENMGKQSVFESFLTWGIEEYPADKMGVILWNHGGALDGCCFDDSVGSDSLLNSETSRAFKNVFDAHGIDKLEFIGYDACLMQIQDVADFNSKYFNYMVGSEEAENGDGWTYNGWIDNLYRDESTTSILAAACDTFLAEYGNSSDQTLSYLRLANMDEYREKIEAMSAAIHDTVKNNYNSFKSLLKKVKDFADIDYGWYFTDGLTSYGEVDGLDFLNKLEVDSNYTAFSDVIEAAKVAYNNVVAYSRAGTGAGQAHGLGIIAAAYVNYPAAETAFTNWRSLFI